MNELADERTRPPRPPPNLGGVIACLLELGIAGTFTALHSIVGLLLCVIYAFFFSATRWLVCWLLEDS